MKVKARPQWLVAPKELVSLGSPMLIIPPDATPGPSTPVTPTKNPSRPVYVLNRTLNESDEMSNHDSSWSSGVHRDSLGGGACHYPNYGSMATVLSNFAAAASAKSQTHVKPAAEGKPCSNTGATGSGNNSKGQNVPSKPVITLHLATSQSSGSGLSPTRSTGPTYTISVENPGGKHHQSPNNDILPG